MIRTAMRSKERAAILSTQDLEEAAAMCDRVAIMVSGQLRWASGSHRLSGCHRSFSLGFVFRLILGSLVFLLILIEDIGLFCPKCVTSTVLWRGWLVQQHGVNCWWVRWHLLLIASDCFICCLWWFEQCCPFSAGSLVPLRIWKVSLAEVTT